MTTNDQLPENVHMLRPRKLALADRLDQFLEAHALHQNDLQVRCDPTRPRCFGPNALICAACDQTEYITRDYCRCGHYLRGQLEDEFIAWEAQIHADHDRLAEVIAEKLKPLRFVFMASSPFIVVPMLHLALWAGGLSIYFVLSIMVGLALFGAAAWAEWVLLRPVKTSFQFLNNYTFESYAEDRFFRLKVVG